VQEAPPGQVSIQHVPLQPSDAPAHLPMQLPRQLAVHEPLTQVKAEEHCRSEVQLPDPQFPQYIPQLSFWPQPPN
jgi:hypothetical protein